MRRELKYFLDRPRVATMLSRLRHLLPSDAHGHPVTGYRVRSAYFDSIFDTCLEEKLGGKQRRNKYRLRFYDDTRLVRFEVKQKRGGVNRKLSAKVSMEHATAMLQGNFECLLDRPEPFLQRTYAHFMRGVYRPKVIVEYQRQAFLHPAGNLRVTLDTGLRASFDADRFFEPNLLLAPVFMAGREILEIKFNQALPVVTRAMLQLDACEHLAISKYTLCRRLKKARPWEDN